MISRTLRHQNQNPEWDVRIVLPIRGSFIWHHIARLLTRNYARGYMLRVVTYTHLYGVVALVYYSPVDDLPQLLDAITAHIAVVDIVGVLPHIYCQKWRKVVR